MDLSPNDIRNYEFPNQMRGYDKEEVDSFLDQIATVLENMKQENLRLSMENDSIKSQLESLKQFEDTIKSAAIDARKNADRTIGHAKEESEKMLNEARAQADDLVNNQEHKIKEYSQQLDRLEQTKQSFVTEIRDMISLHLDMVNKISDSQFSFTPDNSNGIEVTESSEVSRQDMTTIASGPKSEKVVTEEVNAASAIIAVPAASDSPEPEAEKPLDPDLAKALAEYQHPEPTQEQVTAETMIGANNSIPKQGEVIETTKRAEDIPDGFIATVSDDSSTDEVEDTDKVGLAPDVQDASTEHNNIDMDTPIIPEKKEEIPTSNIVEELDNVVAKFEEEMDKAEKS